MATRFTCPPGYDCTSSSCPALSVPCPYGSFCGDALATGVDRAWLDVEFSRFNDDPQGTTYTDYWAERPCFRGLSCANSSTLTTCEPGTWCPTGNAGPLGCDALSFCGARAYFQVNFIVVVIAVALTAVVVGVSTALVRRQRAAAAACRAQASRGVLRALEPEAVAGADVVGAHTAGAQSAEAEDEAAAAAKLAADLEGAPPDADAAAAAARGAGLDFVFRDVTLATPRGVALLHGVSGRAAPGRVTALLGPSGSGKTLLLALLRDGGDPAHDSTRVTRGSVTVNGVAVRDAACSGGLPLRARVGYVPKDDVLDRDLTPRELLTLSAALRLPAGTPRSEVDAAVTDTLAALGLTGVADVVVGGSASAAANISGGQLKRVSVGYELVARPQALFLDEPTSGLDATAALDLVATLRRISRSRGVTVLVVLHQPRAEVWRLLDHVLLMARARDQVAPPLLVAHGQLAAGGSGSKEDAAAGVGGGEGAEEGEEGGPHAGPPVTAKATAVASPRRRRRHRAPAPLVGGCVIYEGPPSGAVPYFTHPSVGYALPPGRAAHVNPADFCLDVAGGLLLPAALERQVTRVQRSTSAGSTDSSSGDVHYHRNPMAATQLSAEALRAANLSEAWRRHSRDAAAVAAVAAAVTEPQLHEPALLVGGLPPAPARPGLWTQADAQARRAFVVRMRGTGFLALYGFLHVFLSVALATGFSPVIQGDYGWAPPLTAELQAFVPSFLRERAKYDVSSEGMQQLMFFVTVACGICGGMAATGLFSKARAFGRRDVGAGLSPLAFAAGRMASDLLIIGWDASLFAAVWMLLAPAGHWYQWLAIYAGVGFASSGVGYIAGALLSTASSGMACMVVALLCAVFSGIEPPLKEVVRLPVVNWAWYLSFGTWVAQAVLIAATGYADGIRDRLASAAAFGFDLGGFGTAIGAMFGIGLLLRAVALLVVHATTTGEPLPGWNAAVRALRGRGPAPAHAVASPPLVAKASVPAAAAAAVATTAAAFRAPAAAAAVVAVTA